MTVDGWHQTLKVFCCGSDDGGLELGLLGSNLTVHDHFNGGVLREGMVGKYVRVNLADFLSLFSSVRGSELAVLSQRAGLRLQNLYAASECRLT